ncbi:hypothetical protein [Methylosinus sp. Ce-a6]|uniref:hypothetical protein n=1 Tax=Methylosinus sp. Ce-a6 TaxID=2172005 RepID=UPI001FCED921|nr:hypothetical protein [Methylosinus sp. Ce-a6]
MDPDFGSCRQYQIFQRPNRLKFDSTWRTLEDSCAQAIAHYSPLESIDLFASIGYQRAEFAEDLPLLPGASAATYWSTRVKGRQLPNAPYWISTIGGDLRIEEFIITPIYQQTSANGVYFPGAPRTVLGKVGFEF